MGNGRLRCFLACVLPCGALDIVRIVHINGHVDEYIHQISAGEVLKANPNHVLSKPFSQGGVSHKIVLVSPDSNLKRGDIYFLVPAADISLPNNGLKKNNDNNNKKKRRRRMKVSEKDSAVTPDSSSYSFSSSEEEDERSNHRGSVRVGVWKPHLQSILEDS